MYLKFKKQILSFKRLLHLVLIILILKGLPLVEFYRIYSNINDEMLLYGKLENRKFLPLKEEVEIAVVLGCYGNWGFALTVLAWRLDKLGSRENNESDFLF